MDFADLVQSAEQLTTDCDLSILSGAAAASAPLAGGLGASAAGDRRVGGRHGGAQGAAIVGLPPPEIRSYYILLYRKVVNMHSITTPNMFYKG